MGADTLFITLLNGTEALLVPFSLIKSTAVSSSYFAWLDIAFTLDEYDLICNVPKYSIAKQCNLEARHQ